MLKTFAKRHLSDVSFILFGLSVAYVAWLFLAATGAAADDTGPERVDMLVWRQGATSGATTTLGDFSSLSSCEAAGRQLRAAPDMRLALIACVDLDTGDMTLIE